MPPSPTWLTASQAARRLHVSPRPSPAGPATAAWSTAAPSAATAAMTPS
jgi:hypothetical protein